MNWDLDLDQFKTFFVPILNKANNSIQGIQIEDIKKDECYTNAFDVIIFKTIFDEKYVFPFRVRLTDSFNIEFDYHFAHPNEIVFNHLIKNLFKNKDLKFELWNFCKSIFGEEFKKDLTNYLKEDKKAHLNLIETKIAQDNKEYDNCEKYYDDLINKSL